MIRIIKMPLFRIALFGEKLHYGLSDMYQSSDEFLFYYSHAAARLQLLHNEENKSRRPGGCDLVNFVV